MNVPKIRILLVDDEVSLLDIGTQMFEYLGYEVTCRQDGLEALEAFRVEPEAFDLVMTDHTMPNMTGTELAKKLLEIRPDVPIILCSGFSEIIDQDDAVKIGVQKVIAKPFVFSEVADIARGLLLKTATGAC
jgi:two-component system, cell cycle sensor histidine kinase and response regulator CckA